MSNPPVIGGDFCCVPVSGAAGVLIGLGERLNGDAFSRYRHAEFYIPAEHAYGFTLPAGEAPHGYTFGAYPEGARLKTLPCPAASLPGALWSSGALQLTAHQRIMIISACRSLEGTPYGWLDYVALALHRLGVPAPGLRAFIGGTRSMMCSQVIDAVELRAGVHLFTDGRWPGYVTPAELAGFIESRQEASGGMRG